MPTEPQAFTAAQAIQIGLQQHRAGHLREAEAVYKQVLEANPDNPEALHLLGVIAHQLGQNEAAVQLIDKALAISPKYPEALSNRGNALKELGRFQEALASCDAALALRPDHAEALNNRGNALEGLQRYAEALASFDQALAIRPELSEAASNRGYVLSKLERFQEALASYDRALAIKADAAEVLYNRGIALKELGRPREALASFDKVLAIRPDDFDARMNASQCRLLTGDFERGWEDYEWRLKDPSAKWRDFSQPLWQGGDDIAGKSILLHAEQGLGDTIQFVRYAAMVAEKGARVILQVPPALGSTLAGQCGAHQVLTEGEPLPEFDCHCPLLSLPRAFRTRLETIPAKVPYLRASADKVATWKKKLGRRRAAKIGIVWSGRPDHTGDRNRSMALERLLPLARRGTLLVSLQNTVRAADEKVLAGSKQVLHFGAELADLSDTAALASLMDLVISVDTSVAHLAGALGKPVWILLPFVPDWHWLLERENSPWYPSARLFRQPARGDWDSVIGKLKRELRKFIAKGR